jgi:subtilisin family serine protease
MSAHARGITRARARSTLQFGVLLTTLVLLFIAGPATAATAPDPLAADAWQTSGDGPMGAASAWDQTVGGEVVVAVIDSGTDLTHPDLAPNLWVNPGEIAGNGRDDDGDGFVDDVHGVDLVNGDGDPQDDNGHGTHVAGIIAARGGNGIGATGVAWRALLMSVKVLGAAAEGDTDGVAAGIDYAVGHGARIINLSLAGNQPSATLDRALIRARDAGVLVLAAAGNQGKDLGVLPTYPATSTLENVVAVGATDIQGALSLISSFGKAVDLVAPGEMVLAPALGGDYEFRTGTSMAAPMAAGAAALVASVAPGADWRVMRDALVGGARSTGLPIGGGALDAAGALRRVVAAGLWRTPATTAPAPQQKKAKRKKAKRKLTAAQRRARARRARARARARARSRAAARASSNSAGGPRARTATRAPLVHGID